VHPYKLKLIWLNIITDDELMDSDDIAYDLYQHARDWMQQISMKMLPDHISDPDELHQGESYGEI
jgi:hypothetical protein